MAIVFIASLILVHILSLGDCKYLDYPQHYDSSIEERDPYRNVSKTCGGTITGSRGSILYRYNEGENYGDLDRCIWTIRTLPGTTGIQLIKYPTNFELGYDWISVFSFSENSMDSQTVQLGKEIDSMERVTMSGTVLVVVFTSDASMNYRGFRLDFETEDRTGWPWAYQYRTSFSGPRNYDFNTGTVPGHLIYPGADFFVGYQNEEFSTFVISNGYRYERDNLELWLQWYDIGTDSSCARDALYVYKIERDVIRQIGTFCGVYEYDSYLLPFVGSDFILRFSRGHSYTNTYKGFAISWKSIDSGEEEYIDIPHAIA